MDNIKRFVDLYNTGRPAKEIAAEFGLKYYEARNLAATLRKLGVEITKRPN